LIKIISNDSASGGKVDEWLHGKWEERVEYGKAKRIALSPSGEAYTIKPEEN